MELQQLSAGNIRPTSNQHLTLYSSSSSPFLSHPRPPSKCLRVWNLERWFSCERSRLQPQIEISQQPLMGFEGEEEEGEAPHWLTSQTLTGDVKTG